MADFTQRNVEYVNDQGQTIVISIKYENFTNPSPQTRFNDGGFGTQDLSGQCRTFNRRGLKPRYVEIRYGSSQDAKTLRVIAKTRQVYDQLLNNPNMVRYCGECGCKIQ